MVIVNFIRDKEVGIFARAKRLAKEKESRVAAGAGKVVERDSGAGSDKSE